MDMWEFSAGTNTLVVTYGFEAIFFMNNLQR